MTSFDSIIGNSRIKEHFLDAKKHDRISHCYLLNGEDGMGKSVMAKAVAKMLLCDNEKNGCGECISCRQVESKNHPDLIYVEHKNQGSIGVDDIRDGINNSIFIKPYKSEYKIYIIDEAEKMTVSAQNALLKTLEEPPLYAIIMLLSENKSVFLDTVISRCIILDMEPIPDDQLALILKENNVDDEKIEAICRFCPGNVGKALKFAASSDFSKMIHCITVLLRDINKMDFAMLCDSIEQLSEFKLRIKDCLDFMTLWYKDVLLFKVSNDLNLISFKDEYDSIKQIAKKSDFNGIENIIQAIEKAKRRIDANVNYELTLELLLMTMKDN